MFNNEEELLNHNNLKELAAHITSGANMERKKKSKRAHDIYKGKLKGYVTERLKTYTKEKRVKRMALIDVINFCKKIIDDEASIYSEPPTRKFENVSEEQEQSLVEIYEDMDYNNKAKKHNRYFKLLNQSPSYIIPKKGKLQKKPLLGHQYDIIPSNSDEDHIGIVLSRLAQPKELEKQRFVLWTSSFHFIFNGEGEILGDENWFNPISPIVPFSFAQDDLDEDIYAEEYANEVNFTILINAAITELFHIMRMQGFSIPVLKIPESRASAIERPEGVQAHDDIEISTDDAVTFRVDDEGVSGDLSFVSPNPDLTGSIEVLSVILSAYLTSKGVDPKKINLKGESSQSFSSGWERFLSLVEEFKATQDDMSIFKTVEKEDFEIIRAWHNALTGDDALDSKYKNGIIPENSYVDVKFYEPSDLKTEDEEIQTNKSAEEAGYQSRIMSIRRLFKYETDDEAIQHLQTMKEHQKELIKIGSAEEEEDGNTEQ